MAVESATYINQLDATKPGATDLKSEGDDHVRLVKSAVKATFPNVTGAVTATHTELNYVDGVTSAIQTQLDTKAPTASPTFTGTVALPSTTSIGPVSSTELGYLDGVTSAIQTQIDGKAPASLSTTKADIASPAFTGVPTAPTATAGTSTTQLATTAFVAATAFSSVLPGQTGNAGKYLTTDGTNASWAGGIATLSNLTQSQIGAVNMGLAVSAANPNKVYSIDSDRELILGNNGYCFVYSKAGNSIGSVVSWRSTAVFAFVALLIGTDKMLVVSCPSSTAMETVVLTFSGTAVTVGTPVATTLAGNMVSSTINIQAVDTNYVIAYGRATNVSALRAITVSGTTPTVGTELALSGSTTTEARMAAASTTVLLAVHTSSALLYATPVTVSGTTLTAGTLASTTSTSSAVSFPGLLASGRYAALFTNSTNHGAIISVSGTTATISAVSLGAGTNAFVVSGSQVIAASSTVVNVLTDSSGTAVAGTAVALQVNAVSLAPLGSYMVSCLGSTTAEADVGFKISTSGNNPLVETYTIQAVGPYNSLSNPIRTSTKALWIGTEAQSIYWDGSAFSVVQSPVMGGVGAFNSNNLAIGWRFTLGYGTTQHVSRMELA
jgi:hypothetical protein